MRVVLKSKTTNDSYMDLIREFPLRRIKSAGEHAKALKLLLHLSTVEHDRGVAEYTDVLVDLVVDYEKRAGHTLDVSDVSAADLVQFRLEERGMSVSALAKQIGVPQSNLSDMLNGKRAWSKSAIRGVCAYFNMKAERFLV